LDVIRLKPSLCHNNHQDAFAGSYAADDVQFLLNRLTIADTPVHIKEALIQSGQQHYSELLSHEQPPPTAYQQLFQQALAVNAKRVGLDVWPTTSR
jgi:Phosphoribosyl transferase (PRTase)